MSVCFLCVLVLDFVRLQVRIDGSAGITRDGEQLAHLFEEFCELTARPLAKFGIGAALGSLDELEAACVVGLALLQLAQNIVDALSDAGGGGHKSRLGAPV
jgi:hypothetical protein